MSRITYSHVASTLALVVALGSGGAYAAGLAKNSVGSKQIKNGAVKAVDLKPGTITGSQLASGTIIGAHLAKGTVTGDQLASGTVTGAHLAKGTLPGDRLASGTVTGDQVANGTITGDDVDESTLVLPTPSVEPVAFVGESAYGQGVLTGVPTAVATLTFEAPAAGFVDLTGMATLRGTQDTEFVGAQLKRDGVSEQFVIWDGGDSDAVLDNHETIEGVFPVTAGSHTLTLVLWDSTGSGSQHASFGQAQLMLRWFSAGSAPETP